MMCVYKAWITDHARSVNDSISSIREIISNGFDKPIFTIKVYICIHMILCITGN